MKLFQQFVLLSIFVLLPRFAYAIISVQTTASSGYYKDINQQEHVSMFLNWRVNHIHQSGIETVLDFGLDNNFIRDKWAIYPYQLYVTYPLSNGFAHAPFYRSRIQLGRQLLTEGFELDVIDGAVIPYYFTPEFGIKIFAGGVHIPEETNLTFEDQIYGTSIFLKKWDTLIRFGPIIKQSKVNGGYNGTYQAFLSLAKTWDHLYLSPTLLLKDQWDIEYVKHDQALAELQLSRKRNFLALSYTSRRLESNFLKDRSFIFKLFSISAGKTASISYLYDWPIQDNVRLQINAKAMKVDYISPKGEETGDKEELSANLWFDKINIAPVITRISSYGGELWDFGCVFKYAFNPEMVLRVEGDALWVDKINGIKGWAYNVRSGLDFDILPRFRTNLLVEVQRNHLFEFDVRAIAYVTHFYY
ncbi:MAG: hypothetical protein ISR65_02490 [Bacteriovoracaceae bacterium]|nr:hypothetical protein [Bacteriovoracaceae bacterium]